MSLQVLKELEARGIKLKAKGDALVAHVPKGQQLEPELAEKIRACKSELLAYVRHRDGVARACEALKQKGWFLLNSSILNETIVIARNDRAAEWALKHYPNLVCYTLEEAQALWLGLEEEAITLDGVRLVHEGKKKFGPRSKVWDVRIFLKTDLQ